MDWIGLAQDKGKWRAVVNAVKIRVQGISWVDENRSASQSGGGIQC
jgi:hypothetical protein